MKTKVISIALNVVLLIIIGIGYMDRALNDHYYTEFTGFVLRESASQIEAGNSARVAEILKQVNGRPTYSDLISTLDRLKPKDALVVTPKGPEQPRDAPAR